MLHHLFSTLFQPIVRKSRLIYPTYNILNDNHKYLAINKPSVLRGMEYINHILRYVLLDLLMPYYKVISKSNPGTH